MLGSSAPEDVNNELFAAIEDIKMDPHIGRLVHEHKERQVSQLAQQLPRAPSGRWSPRGRGGGSVIELPEFSALLDPVTGMPNAPSEPKISEERRRKVLDISVDSL